MFNTIKNSLSKIVAKVVGKSVLSKSDLENFVSDLKKSLLESDVALDLAEQFSQEVLTKIENLNFNSQMKPGQVLAKIVHEEIVKILGLPKDLKGARKIMLVGLQGVGKTTLAGKLVKKLKGRTLLVSVDVKRKAAYEQLSLLAEQVGADIAPFGEDPYLIAKEALVMSANYQRVIFDTAGRLAVDQSLMSELENLVSLIRPDEIILVADVSMGQGAALVAREFKKSLALTGLVANRADADSKGGALLTLRYLTKASIIYLGVGEKLDQLEDFIPKRFADRILGFGDIEGLAEKLSSKVSEVEAMGLVKKMMTGKFDLNDLAKQIEFMSSLGGMKNLISFLPGMNNLDFSKVNDNNVARTLAIIRSMNLKERSDPKILNASRKKRIAEGAGVSLTEVDKVLENFQGIQSNIKRLSGFEKLFKGF